MRAAVRLALIAVLALTASCASTTVDVSFDDGEDFSQYRTWDWLPRGRSVDALPTEGRKLAALTSRLIDRELEGRGLVRDRSAPDLLVGYSLEARRYAVTMNETGATDYVSSHHASPSYLVQSTKQRVDVYDTGTLRVMVTDGSRQRMVWRGEVWVRRRGEIGDHLADAVARLLEEYPAAAVARDAGSLPAAR